MASSGPFGFAGRLARVSSLEAKLERQLRELQTGVKLQDEELRKVNTKVDAIDGLSFSVVHLQDEAKKVKSMLEKLQSHVKDMAQTNVTAWVLEVNNTLTASLQQLQAGLSNSSTEDEKLTTRVTRTEDDLAKLSSQLDSHTSAIKTLADTLAVHQNTTLSALQQHTAAMSEALEAHRELRTRVDSIKAGPQQGAGAEAAGAGAGGAAGAAAARAGLYATEKYGMM
ncbi:hypothetical protein GPECTOR_8g226 [Gonium pectorale]|uniref:Uncharacterized protein n=1 Tax=Gonium pectorale TaxID=33097 RepID=A0A150GSQ2_GONPE|nr:hypothetical protein GPECTOR_8g226 [Gonium pectorale]|eukprot:KXZ52843.1 hypothetical protein GPECTOR_8g226 [Gonium pectorale]